ncbi:hypothetical protein, partial [uncultured Bifidobacterium sp.]|uniref:hypothetical protein n=1 Tax=uncultured Bifidobacterium sp. TaxID=165187 RepID=UPI00265D8E38
IKILFFIFFNFNNFHQSHLQILIYQSLISHIIHHKYENFYPPSVDLKFKTGGFFYFQKKLKNFCSEGRKMPLPVQTSEWE